MATHLNWLSQEREERMLQGQLVVANHEAADGKA